MKLKYGSQILGDNLVSIRPRAIRLNRSQIPILGSATGYIESQSPNWIWQVEAVVYTKQTTVFTFAAYLVTLKAYFDDQTTASLLVRNDADSATTATYGTCRVDSMEAPEPIEIPHGRFGNIRFVFTSSTDPS